MSIELTEGQRRHLKGLAHGRKVIVTVGARGLTEAVLNEIDLALRDHELIKVRINAQDRQQRRQMVLTIQESLGTHWLQTVGFVATFYRPSPKTPRGIVSQ
ncbi:MAG: YhbY family RNA-binding protein [Candidatus Competibacterales bacterium]